MKTTLCTTIWASALLCLTTFISCGQSDGSSQDNSQPAVTETTTKPAVESTVPAVDLGLSVKWAPYNVGADKPEDPGYYYAWGETKGMGEEDKSNGQNYIANDSLSFVRNRYDWVNYKYCQGTATSLTKYCHNAEAGKVDGKLVLAKEDDVAQVVMGGSWRMPTKEELSELRSNCQWTWTVLNGVAGYTVVGPNGNSIFLPAAGCRSNQSRGLVSDRGPKHEGGGDYWSSNISKEEDSRLAWRLIFGQDVVSYNYESRCEGACVRAVCN